MKCIVPSCTTDFHKIPAGITQHRFPTDDDRQAQWLEAIRTAENCRPDDLSAVNFNRDRICSKHFHISCFYKVKGQVRLNKYATPFEEPAGPHHNGTSHSSAVPRLNTNEQEYLDLEDPEPTDVTPTAKRKKVEKRYYVQGSNDLFEVLVLESQQ
uniref:(northern house mosquito) hypothetical protein n=1 Tax=Culex pipiens TaxID=7175 RepID=A0A8D8D124_CULPI